MISFEIHFDGGQTGIIYDDGKWDVRGAVTGMYPMPSAEKLKERWIATDAIEQVSNLLRYRLANPFQRIALHLEDNAVHISPLGASPGDYRIASFDVLTGIFHAAIIPHSAMLAIVLLAFLGEDLHNADELYADAEPALTDWPKEVRPIP